jgi:hypothetical protein
MGEGPRRHRLLVAEQARDPARWDSRPDPCARTREAMASAIEAAVGRHSEKPAVFYELIESYFPTLPKIELHARGVAARLGWEVWGLEAPLQGESGAGVVRENPSPKMSSNDAHDDAQARNEAMLHALGNPYPARRPDCVSDRSDDSGTDLTFSQ